MRPPHSSLNREIHCQFHTVASEHGTPGFESKGGGVFPHMDQKSRRVFLRTSLAAGALGGIAKAQTSTGTSSSYTAGDMAIARFIALNEIIAFDILSQLAGQVQFNSSY